MGQKKNPKVNKLSINTSGRRESETRSGTSSRHLDCTTGTGASNEGRGRKGVPTEWERYEGDTTGVAWGGHP